MLGLKAKIGKVKTISFLMRFFILILIIMFFVIFYYVTNTATRWEEYATSDDNHFIIWFPDVKTLLIFPIDRERFPADWAYYGNSLARNFQVSGYGSCCSNEQANGILFYQERYHWTNNEMKLNVLGFSLSIFRGKYIVIDNCSFQIDEPAFHPLIIRLYKDGQPEKLSEYPSDILPIFLKLTDKYISGKFECNAVFLPRNVEMLRSNSKPETEIKN